MAKNTQSGLILSRYLYAIDEVCISFVHSLLHKDIEQALWWFFEYYFSVIPEKLGPNVGVTKKPWQLLFKVYYDYYAIYYPTIERRMAKQFENWCATWDDKTLSYAEKYKKNIEPCISAIMNLSRRKASFDVFILRQAYHKINTSQKSPYRFASADKLATNSKRSWLTDPYYPVGFYGLLWAIHIRDWQNVCYYLRILVEHPEVSMFDLYLKTIHYFITQEGVNIVRNEAQIETQWNKMIQCYRTEWHILLSGIAYFAKWPEDSGFEPFYNIPHIVANPESKLDEKVLEWNKPADNLWDTLRIRRIYAVSPIIKCFQIERTNMTPEEFADTYRMHWEKYSARCPVWKDRFQRYSAEFTYDECVKFTDETKEEMFYETYNLEPDEQPIETQLCSIGIVDKIEIENAYKCERGEVLYLPEAGIGDELIN